MTVSTEKTVVQQLNDLGWYSTYLGWVNDDVRDDDGNHEVYSSEADVIWAHDLKIDDPNYEPPCPHGWEGGFADNH